MSKLTRTAWGLDSDRSGDWRERAACRGSDPEWWTTASTGDVLQAIRNEQARAICAGCPVIAECAQYGRDTDSVGLIWGGKALTHRRHAREHAPPAALPAIDCRVCRRPFPRTVPQQRYCSERCRKRSVRALQAGAERARAARREAVA